MHDVRYAFRLMARQPLFAGLVIGTLTVGIGASTSMFSVVDSVLLKPLPYADASALVWMFGAFRLNDSASVSPPDFVDYRDRGGVFERLGAMEIGPGGVTVTSGGAPARLQASGVSAELMTTLGVAPVAGRDFARSDEQKGSPAILVSQRLAEERFAGAANALGRLLVVDGRARTIVGVMPAGFTLPYDSFIRLTDPVDLYMPLALDGPEMQVRRFHFLRLIGRLKPGESLQHAQSQMDVISRQLAATYPENDTWHLRLVPLHERIVGAVRPVLLLLMAAVALLLLVSCANVASLLLARASARESELALRGALGASRPRVVRQLLVEGFALSLAGGAAGLFVTWWTIAILKRIGPTEFPRLDALAFEPHVVTFALAMAAVTTLVFALAPAMHAARGDLAGAVRPGRAMTMDRSRRLGQRALVVGQLCVSMVLLAGAALVVRGFVHLVSIDAGFSASGVMLTRLPLPPEKYDADAKIDAFYSALVERLASTPGIESAALATAPPLTGANDTAVHRQGRAPASPRDRRFAQFRSIEGDYFGALGIPLLAGRVFDDRVDHAGAPTVVVISQRAAREHFGAEPPVGQTLVIDLGKPVNATVIGVTGDVRVFGRDNDAPPIVYFSARQRPTPMMQVVVRSASPSADVGAAIRGHVQALDPALAIARIDRMDALMADSVAQPRFAMVLIGSFASLALILTLVGVYGTLAYIVAQRRREIGIRLAIGARRRDIRKMVLRQGAALIAIGIPLGLVVSLFTSRLARAVVVDVQPANPLVLVSVAVLLATASFIAVLVPANRAARVEPLDALRAE